jgi:hypothetical protein
MKNLPIEKIWSGDGLGASGAVTLKQVIRNEKVAVYNRLKKGHSEGFEVFIIGFALKGAPLPGGGTEAEDRERYPTANTFGRTAWFVSGPGAEGRAIELFEKLGKGKIQVDTTAEPDSDETETPTLRQPRVARAVVDLNIPEKPFTQKELAAFNKIENYKEVYSDLQRMLNNGTLKVSGTRDSVRGKSAKLFSKVK